MPNMIDMKGTRIFSCVLCFILVSAAGSPDDLRPAFERLKTLVGTWDVEGTERHVVYFLTGRDETLVEDFRGEPTMASFYHMDGDALMLTHYCNAGNQPRMKAVDYRHDEGVLEFRFLDVTNLSAPDAYHTRDLEIRFRSPDHIELDFTGMKGDERIESTLSLKRR